MKLVNLTGQILNLHTDDGNILAIAPSGAEAKVSIQYEDLGCVSGVTIRSATFITVDLPESSDGVLYVVKEIVRERAPHRTDIASPGPMLRNRDGQPIGYCNLVVNT